MKKTKTEKQSFAASRSHVWLRCTASEEHQQKGKNPFAAKNPQADEGNLIHARAARTLGAGIEETIQETQLFANPESDAQSVVDFYVAAVERMSSTRPENYFYVEKDFSITHKNRIYRAIPDAVIYDSFRELIVFDLKTGFVPVSAEDNEQLILYAHAVCRTLVLKPDKITGVIVQSRMSRIEYADIFYDLEFFEKLDRQLDERSGKFVPGSHCKKCNLLTKCKKFRDTLELYLDPSIKDGLTSKPDEWARTLAIAGPARKFFEDLEKEAKEFIELGGTIPDFALKHSGGKRAWFRELEPKYIAEQIGIKENDLFEPAKLITVAAAEKKINKSDRDKLASMIYQPQNASLTVVNERTFLSREGEKFIKVDNDLNKILKKGRKENENKGKTKSENKGKRKNTKK